MSRRRNFESLGAILSPGDIRVIHPLTYRKKGQDSFHFLMTQKAKVKGTYFLSFEVITCQNFPFFKNYLPVPLR